MQKSLYNLKNVKKKTHGGVLLLVTLQALACNFTESNTPPCVFHVFKIAQMVQNWAKSLIFIARHELS